MWKVLTKRMKNSDIQWVGKIPSNWELRKMSNVAETITDYVASGSFASLKENVQYLDKPDYAMLIRTVDLSKKVNKSKVYISKSSYEFLSNSNLFGGEIILPNIGSVGDVYQYKPLYQRASLAPNSIMIRIDKDISKNYYYYYFLSDAGRTALLNLGSNAVQNKFNKTQLRQLRVPVPPINVQERIVNILDQRVSSISKIINESKQSIEDLKKYKQSLITEAVTKGLDPNVEMKYSGIDWIGETPKNWSVKKISNYFSQVKDKNDNLQEENLLSLSYGSVIRRSINSTDGLLPANFKSYNVVELGDIVLRMTDLQNDKVSLRTGFVPEKGIITSAYITIRTNHENDILPKYIQLYLHSFDIYKGFYGMGSGVRQNVTYNDIKKLELLVPSIKEQQEIVSYLDEQTARIDKLIEDKIKVIQELENYKKSLIYEYVTGKKEV